MTVSGGEPLVQKNFTSALVREAKSSGINVILDTNGYWNWEDIEGLLPYVDGLRYDIKIMDCSTHEFYTGVGNEIILDNLKRLSRSEKDVVVVVPLINKINDANESIELLISFIKTLHRLPKVQILPYHHLYASKSNKLGRSDMLFSAPNDEDVIRIKAMLRSEGMGDSHE